MEPDNEADKYAVSVKKENVVFSQLPLGKNGKFEKTIVTLCAIWYHLHNFKKMKNIHGGVLFLVKFPWMFFTFLKLCKWD